MEKVIYTAIIGDYDILKEPSIKTKGWDYLCFTDNTNLKSDNWKIINISSPIISKTTLARIIKIEYYNYVGNYDMSIWIDGSIQIKTNLDDFVLNHMEQIGNASFITLKHPARKDILEEAEACVERNKSDRHITQKQLLNYYKNDYMFDNGLVATGFLMREHNEENEKLCKAWISEVLNYTKRDQLSFNYVLFKHPVKFATLPFSILENEFQLKMHKY